MTLPGPVNALDAWDSMLATARRMGEILHADLLDDERNPFTRQTRSPGAGRNEGIRPAEVLSHEPVQRMNKSKAEQRIRRTAR